MVFDKGSLILANYTAKVKETKEAVETTLEEDAKELGIHDPSKKYEPKLISLGEGWVLQGLDEALTNVSVGEKLSVEVPPEKGFGARDSGKVRLIPLRKFGEKAHELRVGDEIEIEGRIGIVRLVGSGRVRIDFNHKFAGKTIQYEIEIIKQLETDDEKTISLIKRWIKADENKISIEFKDNIVNISLPEDTYLTEGLQVSKRGISRDICRFIKKLEKVIFLEEYLAPKSESTPTDIKKEDESPAPDNKTSDMNRDKDSNE